MNSLNYKYCDSLLNYSRQNSRVVNIGSLPVGGRNPIRIQSMTTTHTMDTNATVEQSIRMIDAGCEYVRITAPSINEAENLKLIKSELKARGYDNPLIADIHFTPKAAEISARYVEKIRINPGNFVDRKKFQLHEYTDIDYKLELERISERFSPLVNICKLEGTAMRIGTNHGSLSDRILSRYGDTPLGMVESALEFIRICELNNFYDIVLSMKSSNPLVMVQAYRLLVSKMNDEGMNYPLHLGVTEAGEGVDGRIKSALGIGTLLADGLGDTIRVSLTEEPEFEIPVAQQLIDSLQFSHIKNSSKLNNMNEGLFNPFEYHRRETAQIENIGSQHSPIVISNFPYKKNASEDLSELGFNYLNKLDKWSISDQSPDYIYCNSTSINFKIPERLNTISKNSLKPFEIYTIDELLNSTEIKNNIIIILLLNQNIHFHKIRSVYFHCKRNNILNPIIFKKDYLEESIDKVQLIASYELGGQLLDGFGDGLWLSHRGNNLHNLAFNILQATRTRISKTEYISCPSCGRTLFDLQETTAEIRKKTNHLKGVKIGIMGCIVNGPGEMADADFGYVGTGEGKISLYKGQEIVKKNIPAELAVNELISLIKEHGSWVESELKV
ncbi:MAG: (E)-4-hydroxy-3-methylbut-2-enyl-diphosphate synthase [Candidatus Marinimicrobia bacterium]|nr:(E)-4-hydroxy-3-methylbut-2-enyl-diphosphate synthase [Candidatus Neomarinimicrobiota bacterium]